MATVYTASNLVAFTRDQLMQAATGLGIYLDLSMSKTAITSAILAK